MPMKTLLAALALSLVATSSALAFDGATEAVIAEQKVGKPVPIEAVADLMQASARWCYLEQAGSCAWTDIYLSVTPEGAEYEIANAWSDTIDIAVIDRGRFENEAICETEHDWLPSVRATRRVDSQLLDGRALRDLKAEIGAGLETAQLDCFDYVYRGADRSARTITLLQRQSRAGIYDPTRDTLVTLHFDPDAAARLTLRW